MKNNICKFYNHKAQYIYIVVPHLKIQNLQTEMFE